ncbi:MAG: hypothetical protein U1E23_14670 [Reyranellaceae bacterium]
MKVAWLQLLYIGLCLASMVAVFWLQAGRHRDAKGCLWWSYSLLAFALGWEAIDAWKFGAPGFPASRWLLVPALLVVMAWAAIADRHHQR